MLTFDQWSQTRLANRSLVLSEKNMGDVMGDPIKQLALTSLALPHAFLENQRQQPTFLWETTTLKANKQSTILCA